MRPDRTQAFDLVGLNALRQLLSPMRSAVTTNIETHGVPPTQRFPNLVNRIAADGHGLVMLMGKGGVGKTTLAAAVAVELAHRGMPVHLTTSDPAAHLTETLSGSITNLTVSRIDPQVETERYRRQVLAAKGAKLMPKAGHCSRRICAPLAPKKSRSFKPSATYSSRQATSLS